MKKAFFSSLTLPDLSFRNISLAKLKQDAPDFVARQQWQTKCALILCCVFLAVCISLVFFWFNRLSHPLFYLSIISIIFIHLVLLPVFLDRVNSSARISKKAKKLRHHYFLKKLSRTPLHERSQVAQHIRDIFNDEQWLRCLAFAREIDKKRANHCCHELGRIAAYLVSNDPNVFCHSMLKTMHHQRGSVVYYLDMLMALAKQHVDQMSLKKKPMRTSQRLLLEDLFNDD